jgi:hypothetical protein
VIVFPDPQPNPGPAMRRRALDVARARLNQAIRTHGEGSRQHRAAESAVERARRRVVRR